MAVLLLGVSRWSAERDEEGHRTYKVKSKVVSDVTDGPANVLQTPGLPVVGAPWIVRNDIDLWAWFRATTRVTPLYPDGEPGNYWEVEQTCSTKPPPDKEKRRCQDTQIQDPLLEPQKVSGGFSKLKREATRDLNGNPILNSAFEQIRGPTVEFDENQATIRVEQNVAVLGSDVWGPMIDSVNVSPLWGFPARCVKLSNVTWERKFQGSCQLYYTRVFEFETNVYNDPITMMPRSGFDRLILDEGTKALNGSWGLGPNDPDSPGAIGWVIRKLPDGTTPNPNNPEHFVRFTDRDGNPMRVILDGSGKPATGETGTADKEAYIFVQKYPTADFTTLGIPLVF